MAHVRSEVEVGATDSNSLAPHAVKGVHSVSVVGIISFDIYEVAAQVVREVQLLSEKLVGEVVSYSSLLHAVRGVHSRSATNDSLLEMN